ncbi:transposable element Tcb2 transposase [Trichonephila clavipes]|nr:transposable element Tcb2 transposase [Trichonephila clavipes]
MCVYHDTVIMIQYTGPVYVLKDDVTTFVHPSLSLVTIGGAPVCDAVSTKAFQTTGTAVKKIGGGHPRTTTAGDDRYIILQAKRGRQQSASAIAQQLCTAKGRQVSRFTVARRLHKGGLFTRCPEHCLPLEVGHRRHRL